MRRGVFLREKFLRVKTGVSGANFLIAETGGVCIVESEGNGRMCLTLPETLITVAGIDKVIAAVSGSGGGAAVAAAVGDGRADESL